MPGGQKQSPGTVEQAVMSALREAMTAQQLHQTEVAARVGISTSQLSRILSGKRAASFTEAVRLATALGVDLAEVVREAEQAEPQPLRVPVEAEVADLILQADLEAEEQREANNSHPCG